MERSGAAAAGDQEGWFTRERVLALILGLATLLGLYVCYLIAKPFIAPIAFALALCVATHRPFLWLRRRFSRKNLAAAVAVVAVALLIVVPVGLLAAYLVQQAAENLTELAQGDPLANWRSAVERQPHLARLLYWIESRFDLPSQVGRIGNAIAGSAANLLRGSLQVLTQLAITLFVLFFLYRDEDQARRWLWSLVPLSREEADRLFARVGNTIYATVNGSLTVAAVQAVLAGAMYWALGVAAPALWGATTFIAALVPVFGTFLVWAPIACISP